MGVALQARLQSYLEPLFLLSVAVGYLPYTLVSHPFLLLTSPSSFRSKWFDKFWRVVGPKMAASEIQTTPIDELLSQANGIVLELGPGTGDQMYHYHSDQIEAFYAAEPNAFFHVKLREAAGKYGLGSKLVTLEAGAQPGSLLPTLKRQGVIPSTTSTLPEGGVFDTIVAIKSLCSAPQDQLTATLAVVQALLKPGGQFLFFEHVGNEADSTTAVLAWVMNLVWPLCMGGCRLDGKVDTIISGMGGWSERRIKTVGDFKGHEIFRYVQGFCSKA